MSAEPVIVSIPSGATRLYGRLYPPASGAPILVLLTGLGYHTFEYRPLAERLSVAGIGCLSVDFRGHGRSDGPRGQWVLSELAADAEAAIAAAAARCGGPVVLYGNSLGAMVAIRAGGEDRVVGVVAASCPARIADFLLTTPRRVLLAMATAIQPVAPIRISLDHFYGAEKLIDDPRWVSAIRRDPLIADARRLSAKSYTSLLHDWDGPAAVRVLHKPLLVIQGRRDRMQPTRQSELLFRAANEPKRYELIDTGHLPHLENPAVVADLVTEWLGRGGGGTGPPH